MIALKLLRGDAVSKSLRAMQNQFKLIETLVTIRVETWSFAQVLEGCYTSVLVAQKGIQLLVHDLVEALVGYTHQHHKLLRDQMLNILETMNLNYH